MKNPEACAKLLRLSIDHIFNDLEYWVEIFGPEKIFVWMSSSSESN